MFEEWFQTGFGLGLGVVCAGLIGYMGLRVLNWFIQEIRDW